MKEFKTHLREAQDNLKRSLINKLLQGGWTKMADGRQLYELTMSELMKEYKYAIRLRKIQ